MDTAQQKIVYKPIERLLLDANNPRLASGAGSLAKTQFEILKVLWTEMAVDELVFSIAYNGYFPEEPMFVIPQNPDDNPADEKTEFIVIEGNRRLAAVLILLRDDWREQLRATNMPSLDEAAKDRIREVPVSIYEDRFKLWTFLTFRHINSPKPWDAFSKAQYVAQVHKETGLSLDEIARRIGDRHFTVERLYRGYKVLQQAEQQTDFQVEDRFRNRFYFSHLYTALDYPEFQDFLGISSESFLKDKPVPEDKEHLSNLNELMLWLYGKKSENKEPVVQKQNPHLKWLRDVISKPAARDALRSGYSLEKAYDISIGDERRFREALTSAKTELQQAKATVTTGYNGDDDSYKTMQDIQEIAKTIHAEMKPKYTKQARRR
jgi:hypothetical protein